MTQSPAFTAQDFAELEALINEPPLAPPTEISLDELLEESMVSVHAAKAVKEGRAKLKDSRTSKKEREEIAEAIRRWELEREWKPKSTVAMFSTQFCENCEYVQGIFSGLFQKEVHRTNHTTRWVIPAAVNSHLPLERKETLENVPMCLVCVESLGYFEEDEEEVAAEIEASLVFNTPRDTDNAPEELEADDTPFTADDSTSCFEESCFDIAGEE